MITYRPLRNYKYILAEPYSINLGHPSEAYEGKYIHLHEDGQLLIGDGYAWDGASGPAIDTANFLRGSLVHDALYQLMRVGHLDADPWRERADQILRQVCTEDGMSAVRAWWVYSSVRAFGWASVAPQKPPPDVLTAP